MKFVATFISFLSLASSSLVVAQRTIDDLLPSHAAALQNYLSKNGDRYFRQEHILEDTYLNTVRTKWGFGKKYKPNYVVADLNRDGLVDFAILLIREGKEEWSADIELNERIRNEHNPDYPLTLLVFNRMKGGRFRVAFSKDLMGPNAAFINVSTERGKKKLYYGVFETDSDTFSLAPAGRGYIIEFEKPR